MEVHTHHIIPKYLGGSDEPENLIELSRYDHSVEHLKLYYQFGNKQDLCAYYMLKGEMEEFRKIYASLGGKAIQKKRKEQGLNSFGLNPKSDKMLEIASRGGKIQGKRNAESGHMKNIQKMVKHSEVGKKGAETNRFQGTNAFFDKELRTEIARKGGAAHKGRIWITDGTINKRILKTEEIPDGFKRGFTQRKRETI